MSEKAYPIGTPGKPWGDNEKSEWLESQSIKRSYFEEVLKKLELLKKQFDVEQYGALSIDESRYPLLTVKTKNFDENKQNVLVTGGVHGYETSGVQGAIRFLENKATDYSNDFNIIVAPCVSPWGYETINRWNNLAIDPNRSFSGEGTSEESKLLMAHIRKFNISFVTHFDLHETTDTDNSEFRPALAARDAIIQENWDIPDGFYLVGDNENKVADFQKAIINSVSTVTHIAPSDINGKIIGETAEQEGVINYNYKKAGLCAGFTGAKYTTTTEVYPDSPKTNNENCIVAQVAAICGGLDFIKQKIK